MGAGLSGRCPCLPHSQPLMGAGSAGDLPVYECMGQIFLGAGLAGRLPASHVHILATAYLK